MGVAELREAFNAVAEPTASCNQAFLTYERAHDTEFQRLAFSGRRVDGAEFTIRSDLIRPGAEVLEVARQTAQRLLKDSP